MSLADVNDPAPPRVTLDAALATFAEWLGDSYDRDAMVAAAAIATCQHLDGDAPWLLIVSGSGFTKTETVSALAGAGAHVTSTITSEGALLSATSKKEKAKDATGGLLRVVGDSGVIVIKDVTSILSMGRELRAQVLAALREVADGYWERNVGTDGGRTLRWAGKCIVVGAVTSAWDKHYSVVAEMGDRFLLLRMDSADAASRKSAGTSSLRQTGREKAMRQALSDAVKNLVAHRAEDALDLDDDEEDLLLGLADVVTRCRTAVEKDYHGTPEWAHALEAPTRLAKYLWMLTRGAVAIGATRAEALALAVRVAADCLPPNRRMVLGDVAANPGSRTGEVAKRLQLPYATADRTLQELHLLGAVSVESDGSDKRWQYRTTPAVDTPALAQLIAAERAFPPGKSLDPPSPPSKRAGKERQPHLVTDISGENPEDAEAIQTAKDILGAGQDVGRVVLFR